MAEVIKNIEQSFQDIPLWGILLITVGIIFTAFESGFFLGKYRYRRLDKEKDALVGPMAGATLGLLAFMLSFTFGAAASHFTARKHLVLDEASAIKSAYAMTDLLAVGPRAESRKLLCEYVDIRLQPAQSLTLEDLNAMISRSNQIQDQLWSIAMTGEAKSTGSSSSSLYVQSLSDMINMQSKRISYGSHGSISTSIWVGLYLLAILSMSAMGYHAGLVGIRGLFAYLVLILTFSLVMVLIHDLDRPKQRFFKVSQQAMIDLRERMNEPAAQIGQQVFETK
jgi:hypothetical protein